LLISGSAACYGPYSTRISDPVPLIDGLHSYKSVAEVRERLGLYRMESLDEFDLKSNIWEPNFLVEVFSVSNYVHGRHAGELRLEFYNDRLAKTWFMPDQPEAYFSTLGLIVPEERRSLSLSRARIQAVGRDEDGAPWISWHDERLAHEWSRWVREFR
jgi:hypothetical protein